MSRPVLLALLVGLVAAPTLHAQRPAERRCLVVLLGQDRDLVREQPIPGYENLFAGGNVRLRCQNQQVFLGADSVMSLNGDVVELTTRAYYRDADVDLTADSLLYTRLDETLKARGNVRIVNRRNGSVLTGAWVDHLRAVRGVRDTAETNALQRPTVTYAVARAEGDTAEPSPYTIEADRMRERGPALEAWGGVVITRDSLRGLADSVRSVNDSVRTTVLFGPPAELRRSGSDSFTVIGNEVHLGLQGEVLETIRAYGGGRVTNALAVVDGDSVSLAFEGEAVTATRAWDRARPARVVAEGYDIQGDSVAIDTPGERLRELRVFGNGLLLSPEPVAADSAGAPVDTLAADSAAVVPDDSTATDAPIRDRMTGNRLTARFTDWDSAGTILTRLVDIVATGNATSLTSRDVERNGRVEPTINYTRADTIIVLMKTGDTTGVAEVRALRGRDPVDGVQLERASLAPRRPAPPAAARPGEGP